MHVFGLMVVRNEADRYLQSSLWWNTRFTNGFLVYDEGSDDETFDLVKESGCHYTQRPDGVPTFLENESKVRQDALLAAEELFKPEEGDWFLVVDADEFLVVDGGWQNLHKVAGDAERKGCKSVTVRIPEVWSLDPVRIRTDGYWNTISGLRFFRWEKGASLKDVAMGGGPQPEYVNSGKTFTGVKSVNLLHVGYADELDRKSKYERYASMNHGHNNAHINSILATPTLKEWKGDVPDIWRGATDE